MNRRSLAVGIVLAWVGSLAWLGFRELESADTRGDDLTLRTVPPGAAYYVVTVNQVVVGYASHTIDTVPEGIAIDDRLMLELPLETGVARTDVRTIANLTNRFSLRDFQTSVGSNRGSYVSSGSLSGPTAMDVQLRVGNDSYSTQLNVTPPVTLAAYLPLRLAFGSGLSVDEDVSLPEFNPVQWESDSLRIEVLQDSVLILPDSAVWDSTTSLWVPARWDTIPAWKIRVLQEGLPSEIWIDRLGQLVSMENALGFRLTRTAFEIAFHNFRNQTDVFREGAATAFPLQSAIAAGVTNLSPTRTALGFISENPQLDLRPLADSRQELRGDTLIVRADEGEVLRSTLRLPAEEDGPWGRYLISSPVMQAGDPRVQARARLIIDGTRNASRATVRLVAWVHDNLAKRPSIGVPSALSVLEAGGGDSYEHATLFLALARAVGLPAKPAAGLLYANGDFYYHVWAEVDLGSGWVAVDPTFGQFPADASHIRFTSHLPAGDFEMVRLIGNPMLGVVSEEG